MADRAAAAGGDNYHPKSHPIPISNSSERGVVFFRGQEVTDDDEKKLVDGLGKATGKPACSGLHIHPLTDESSEFGDEISVISSKFVFTDKVQHQVKKHPSERTRASAAWVRVG